MLCPHVHVCTMCGPGTLSGQKRVFISGPGVQKIVSCYVGVGS